MLTTVLMIEKPLAAADLEMVTTLHGDEPVSFVVLMQPRGSQAELLRALDDVALVHLDEAAKENEEPTGESGVLAASEGMAMTLRSLRDAGSEATGQIVESEPLEALRGVVESSGADEVLVLTAPRFIEEFFHRDWASRARHTVGVPVLKLFAHTE